LSYLNILKEVCSMPATSVNFVPRNSGFIQTASALGVNSIYPTLK